MGDYISGEKRFEIRHANDLRFEHTDSMAAPASRPKLGRPATVQAKSSPPTDQNPQQTRLQNRFDSFPNPPAGNGADPPRSEVNKDAVGNQTASNHETSSVGQRQPASLPQARENSNGFSGQQTGPPPGRPFRPVRASRNPNPIYVDAMSSWTASQAELDFINRSISTRSVG